MAFPTVSVLDNFNRANGAPGSNWVAGFGDTLPSINSNALKGAAGAWYGAAWAPSGSVAVIANPQEAIYTLTAADTGGAQMAGIMLRGININTGTYSGYIGYLTSGGLRIGRYNAGTWSGALASGTAISGVAAGDKLGMEVIGTGASVVINLYYAPAGVWPGTPSLTYTDVSGSRLTADGGTGLSWNQTAANSNGADDFGTGTTSAGSTPITGSESYTMSDSSVVGVPNKTASDSGTESETSLVNSNSTTVEGTLSESARIDQTRTDGAAVTDTGALSTGTDKAGIESPTVAEAAVVNQFVNLTVSDGATGAEAVAGANAPTVAESYTAADAGASGTTLARADSASLTTELSVIGGVAPPPSLKLPLGATVGSNLGLVTITPNNAAVVVAPNIAAVEVG